MIFETEQIPGTPLGPESPGMSKANHFYEVEIRTNLALGISQLNSGKVDIESTIVAKI